MANNFRNYTLKAAGTTAQNAYAVGAGVQATVIGMTIANITASPISANVILNGGNITGNVYLVKDATIAPGGALVPVGGDQKLVLQTNDNVKIVSDTMNSIDAVMSIMEIT